MNNLVLYRQDVAQNSMETIVPDLAESWSWSEDGRPHQRRLPPLLGCRRGSKRVPSPDFSYGLEELEGGAISGSFPGFGFITGRGAGRGRGALPYWFSSPLAGECRGMHPSSGSWRSRRSPYLGATISQLAKPGHERLLQREP
jgi:hypothetical protein